MHGTPVIRPCGSP